MHEMSSIAQYNFYAYDLLLQKTILLISYYCCWRAGEVVGSNTDEHTLKINQFKFCGRKLYIKLVSFKHCNNYVPDFCIEKAKEFQFYPVELLGKYFQVRPPLRGPVFIHKNGNPVQKQLYSKIVKRSILTLRLTDKRYNPLTQNRQGNRFGLSGNSVRGY